MTKWNELTRWLSKHPTFNWSQMNIAFGHRPSDLNSYTTYLNTIKNAGFVIRTGRGEYKVLDPKYVANVSRREMLQYIQLDQAADIIREKKGRINLLEDSITRMCEERTQLNYQLEEKTRVENSLISQIELLEGRLRLERKIVADQSELLGKFRERIDKFGSSFFGRLAALFKRYV